MTKENYLKVCVWGMGLNTGWLFLCARKKTSKYFLVVTLKSAFLSISKGFSSLTMYEYKQVLVWSLPSYQTFKIQKSPLFFFFSVMSSVLLVHNL